MAAMTKTPGSQSEASLCDEIDEFFRLKFRKLSFEDAKHIMLGLGAKLSDAEKPAKVEGLDDKFWVWETLEEATRPQLDTLSKDEIETFYIAWSLQMKGSEEMNDLM